MPLPALAAVAGLAAAAHLGQRGSTNNEENKLHFFNLISDRKLNEAKKFADDNNLKINSNNTNQRLNLPAFGSVSRTLYDASGLDFSGMNLSSLDLSFFSFAKSSFRGTDLSECNITGSDFFETDLSDALIDESKIVDCYFYNSNLINAKLRGATLFRLDLSTANLSNADLTGSKLLLTRGIDMGVNRTFIGIPSGHRIVYSAFTNKRSIIKKNT